MILIQTTTSSKKEAKEIAKILVEQKLCACIQILPIESIYMWENRFCEDVEYLLLIKTKKDLFNTIERKIKENHSYDVPEIIALDIENSSQEYLKFVQGNTIWMITF